MLSRIANATHPATSSGGFSASNPFSPQNQRRADHASAASNTSPLEAQDTAAQFSPLNPGLVTQSLDGGALEGADAAQGADTRTREAFAHEARRDFGAESGNVNVNGLRRRGKGQGQGGGRAMGVSMGMELDGGGRKNPYVRDEDADARE